MVEVIKLKARTRKGGRKLSLRGIARELNDEGYTTQVGKDWTAQQVKNVLAQPEIKRVDKRRKKTQLESSDYLTLAQVQHINKTVLPHLDRQDRLIFQVLVGAGLRASELCALEVRDLGVVSGKQQIDIRRGKGCKQRTVYIDDYLQQRLREYITWLKKPARRRPVFTNWAGQLLSYKALYLTVKRIGKMAGILTLRPHVLRHTFATLLYNYQNDLIFVQEQLGHASIVTTTIYSKTLSDSKLKQMNAFGRSVFFNQPVIRQEYSVSKLPAWS